MKTTALLLSLLAVPAFASQEVSAEDDGASPASRGSVLAGRTVGEGATVVHAEIGWPGLSGVLLSGRSETLDVGGRFTFHYGSPFGFGIAPGLALQGVVRLALLEQGNLSLGLRSEP